jgi:hypothetical protein
MQRAFMLSAFVVVMTWAANATAGSPKLNGAYGVTGSTVCVAGLPGLHFTGLTPPPMAFVESHVVDTIRTFNNDGTGTATGSTMGIVYAATFAGVSSSTIQFSFTYIVNADGSWTSQAGAVTGAITSGSRAGQTYTISNFPLLSGLISDKATTLTLATLTPQVETISYSNGDVVERICSNSRVLVQLPK